MDRSHAATFLQGCPGLQPLIILMFLQVGGSALTLPDMRSLTGKSPDAIQPALDGLCVKGLLVKQIGQHGKPSYLPSGSSFFGLLGGSLFLSEQIPVLPESGATTTTLINRVDQKLLKVVEADTQIPVLPESGMFADNLVACRSVRIGEPKASKISNLPWVEPDFIRAHVAALAPSDKIGLAILRIENNESPPKVSAAVVGYAAQLLTDLSDEDEPRVRFCTWQANRRSRFCHQPISDGNRCVDHVGLYD